MYVDRSSEIWLEQEELGVVVHFNLATGVVKREQMKVEYSNADRSRPAFHIHEDVNGYLWVHPYGGGFSYFDRERNCLVPFYDDLDSHNWRFSNKIHMALYPFKRIGKGDFPQCPFLHADSGSSRI